MNLILLDEADRTDQNRALITGRSLRHARVILGATPGARLRVGFAHGAMGVARVINDSAEAIEVEFETWVDPPPAANLILLLCLPRPKVIQRVLQTASCLGVKEIHLLNAYRVEKDFWHCDQLKPARIDLALRLGLEQARDTVVPTVSIHRRLKPFVQDELPGLITQRTPLIAHPGGTHRCPAGGNGSFALAVGPEGGFIPFEIDLFRSVGFSVVHLGPRILKVETALTALMTRLTL